jgi:hypothetical protein
VNADGPWNGYIDQGFYPHPQGIDFSSASNTPQAMRRLSVMYTGRIIVFQKSGDRGVGWSSIFKERNGWPTSTKMNNPLSQLRQLPEIPQDGNPGKFFIVVHVIGQYHHNGRCCYPYKKGVISYEKTP